MLRVTVELVPHGDIRRAEVIATGWIANGGNHDDATADYYGEFKALERPGDGSVPPFYPSEPREWSSRSAAVERFPRVRLGVWHLVRRAIESALPVGAVARSGRKSTSHPRA